MAGWRRIATLSLTQNSLVLFLSSSSVLLILLFQQKRASTGTQRKHRTNHWSLLFGNVFVFPRQIDSRNQFCFNFHFHKSSITTAGINMKIGYLPYASDCWENHKKITVPQTASQLEFSKRNDIFFSCFLSHFLSLSHSFHLAFIAVLFRHPFYTCVCSKNAAYKR